MKIHKIVLTETADQCLLNIAEYIALDSAVRAETFIEDNSRVVNWNALCFSVGG